MQPRPNLELTTASPSVRPAASFAKPDEGGPVSDPNEGQHDQATNGLGDAGVAFDDLRLLADNLPTLCWIANADGYIYWYNRRWHDYCGTTPAQVEGWGWQAVHDQAVLPRVLEQWRASIATGLSFEMTFPLRGADGVFRPFLTRVQPVRDLPVLPHPQGRVTRWVGTNTDVSAQVAAEAALRASEMRLFGLNQTLTRLVEEETAERAAAEEQLRQSQKMEAVGQLTGGLAHDFNNLLAGISGSLQLIRRRVAQGRTGELGRYVEAALAGSDRAAALTHRLLAFSRRQTLDPKPTNVNDLVAGMEGLFRHTVGPAVELETRLADAPWLSLCDPNQVENALLNVVINARDAMPGGGHLTIETANAAFSDRRGAARMGPAADVPPGEYVALSVTDTGAGMAAGVLARAFDPFFTTKPLGQGTGLGLSMVYGFVRQTGGRVHLRSEVGAGTTVTIHLPRHLGAPGGGEARDGAGAAPPDGTGAVVLVVEDEPPVMMVVTEVLSDRGYTVLGAGEGRAALAILESGVRVDLLVTDVGLPGGMNGRQLADAARRTQPRLKVLFVTGYAEGATVGDGRLDGGMQVMTKPFMVDALAARVREMIDA